MKQFTCTWKLKLLIKITFTAENFITMFIYKRTCIAVESFFNTNTIFCIIFPVPKPNYQERFWLPFFSKKKKETIFDQKIWRNIWKKKRNNVKFRISVIRGLRLWQTQCVVYEFRIFYIYLHKEETNEALSLWTMIVKSMVTGLELRGYMSKLYIW